MKVYAERRARLMKRIGYGNIAVVATANVALRNRDSEYAFRPDSDFYYLTGFAEPEAVAVFIPGKRAQESRYILFCRERDPLKEVWNGRRAGQEGVLRDYGADEAYPIGELAEKMGQFLENRQSLYYAVGKEAAFDQQVMSWRARVLEKTRAGVQAPSQFIAIETIIHEMRLIKDRSEVALMRQAAQISAQAHCRAMRLCRPGMQEFQLEAELLHEFTRHGSRAPAYNSIVAGGENGCILHYTENSAELKTGDLLLIDAGCELGYYASDITRTFPVNGRFSAAQRALYEVVLAAQHAAIAQVKPGKRWHEPHAAAVRVLTAGLLKLGILKGTLTTALKEESYRRFYMHRTGHWLGMDVHDVGDYRVAGAWRKFEPGMVLTVEPGLYIPPGSRGVAKKWWNIGIRIEDDLLVTATSHEILTRGVPKSVAEIEALMAGE